MALLLLTVFTLLGLGAAAEPTDNCPASVPRDDYLTVYNGACYQFVVDYQRQYSDADAECKSHGGSLVLVKSQNTTDYLVDKLIYDYGHGNKIWIGLNDRAQEGTFVWADDSPLDYTNWNPHAGPNSNKTSSVEDCVTLLPSNGGQWDDDTCEDAFFGLLEHRNAFVCQYRLRHVSP